MQLKHFAVTICSVVFLNSYYSAKAQPEMDILQYINTYKELAIAEMLRTGVPASIKLAQGIHETYAGKSELVLKSNNHFGIKCKATWTGKKVYHDDDARGECFRSYASSSDSYHDHSDFLRGSARYSFLFQLDPTDYKAWAYGLKKAGYATNIKYSQIIIKLIEEYNLQQYSLIALGKQSPNDEAVAVNEKPASPKKDEMIITVTEVKKQEPAIPAVQYPTGEFLLNNTRVIFAQAGTSLLDLAQQYDIPLSRLLDFNDLKNNDVLVSDQLVFLQRKRKTGANEFHFVQKGESLYDIAQKEAIRLESLIEYNHLQGKLQPAAGEKLYLHTMAPSKPALAQMQKVVENNVQPVVTNNKLSASTTHVVQTKETLYSISKKYGVGVEQLKEWNNLPGVDVKTGQELVIYKNKP